MKNVIDQIGGWPVTNPDWSEDDSPDLEQILGILKRNFTMGVLIEEWIGQDDKNSKKHIIQVFSISIRVFG